MRSLLASFLFLISGYATGLLAQQDLTLADCHRMAMEHHPLGQQRDLLRDISGRQTEQIRKSRLPQVDLFALAGVQSEAIEFPFEGPGFPQLDLPLYKAVAGIQLQYALYDGGVAKARREQEAAAIEAETFGIEVDLEQLKERVNDLFFGSKMQEKTREIILANRAALRSRISQAEALVQHGVALPAQVSRLQLRELELEAALLEAESGRRASLKTLGHLLGTALDTSVRLISPPLEGFAFSDQQNRPERELLRLEKERILAGADLIGASRKPRLLISGTAGAGYPNQLNLFDLSFRPYALAELRLQWPILDWGKARREREILSLQARVLENRREVFDYGVELEEDRYREEIGLLAQRIARDRRILELQNEILAEVSARLDNGVATADEYIDQLNKRLEAQLQLELHQLQLTRKRVDYLTHKGQI